ncbi:glycosyltransferase family 2 protein [Marinilabiliaceae bacterium ANBcel2]|nr:glycosyltransferase family 2 protein [Marinilabiliaceae bacterium ANBcel2]
MDKKVTCFIANGSVKDLKVTIDGLQKVSCIEKVYVVAAEKPVDELLKDGVDWIKGDSLKTTDVVKSIADKCDTPYALIYSKNLPLNLGAFAVDRLASVADDTSAGLVYSDYVKVSDGKRKPNPVIDYQDGSLRDDFDFGSVLFYDSSALKSAVADMDATYKFAGLYDLRLKVSQKSRILRLPEPLYTEMETDTRHSGEKIFDYVDPKNREVQIEMEKACTDHLKKIGGWLKPEFENIEFDKSDFPVEASVIIPVMNRVKTVEDAVKSVLSQKTPFKFNLIVVDNHSTDGTSEILEKYAADDDRLIHVIPERKDLGIGGCWNQGAFHPACGKFAIQLDSDDMYIDDNVIKTVVEAFYDQNCAMVIGSYRMVNFKLEEIPPGIIDHREWTPDNGRNNALRINGLGAPRAFYTPVLRKVRVPNTSYGEDYALGLNISRKYQIGRIYDPLYLCRRWDDNSDASLDIQKMNAHNIYKDRIRTMELWARIKMNKQ